MWRDLRYGARMLRRNPGFSLVVVLTLALGIGANTAIFSLVNSSLWRRLPVAEPERLVYAYSGNPGSPYSAVSYPDYVELREQNQVFSGLAAWGGITASLNSDEQTDLVTGAIVSGNHFQLLGVKAQLGRALTPQDDQTPGAHPVVVISHGLWQRRFGANPGIVGQQVRLNGQSFTIVGVLPAEFSSIFPARRDDIYVPMMMQPLMRPPRGGYSGEMNPDLLGVRGNRWLWLVGRLKPGVTLEQAQASLLPITRRQEELYPGTNRNRFMTLTRVSEGDPTERGTLLSAATLLMSVVGIVLLIACANVANLQLARASARRKEIALRLALGANRARLVRLLLTESVLLALVGGGVGLLLALWLVDALSAAPPPPGVLPVNLDFRPDERVFAFTLVLSMLTGIVFGLAPALQSSRPELASALKDDLPALDQQHRRLNLRNLLVVAQVALSLLLLIGAGLFLRSLWRAQAIAPGFDAERLLTVPLNINLLRYTRAQGSEFYRQAAERVTALPGVESASLARIVPLGGSRSLRSLLIEGRPGPDSAFRSEGMGTGGVNAEDVISVGVVGLSYFRTLGIGFKSGRDFTALDGEGKPAVVIVNEAFARRHFGEPEALGHRLSLNGTSGPWREIVGVVRDSKYHTLGEPETPFIYLPLAQNHETGMTLLVRARGEPSGLVAEVRQAVQELDRNLPVANVRPLTELIGNTLYAARMGAALLGGFGLLALLLAAVGLYGVMAYVVARRTREIGIRMALGARPADVLRLVLREGMTLVAIGSGAGLFGAWAASRLLASFLYSISATDAVTYVGASLVLAAVAFLANFVPARRATKVDPIIALRCE